MTRSARVRRRPRPARGAVLLAVVVAVLATGGCRGGAAAAPSSAPNVVGPAAAGRSVTPLDGVERRLDGIEEQVDRDGAG